MLMRPLIEADFPLVAIGALVYGKTQSSPILTALSDEIAADLCARLNFSDIAGYVSPKCPPTSSSSLAGRSTG